MHSLELHASQDAGFTGTTLAKAGKKLDELDATLASGKTRRGRTRCKPRSSLSPANPCTAGHHLQLAGDQPWHLRLTWSLTAGPRRGLGDGQDRDTAAARSATHGAPDAQRDQRASNEPSGQLDVYPFGHHPHEDSSQ